MERLTWDVEPGPAAITPAQRSVLDELKLLPVRSTRASLLEAADPRAGVLGGLLGRFADQPGERDEGRRGEHEQHDISRMEGEVDDERDRGERERRPEELPRHADTLTACPRRSSSTGVTP